MITEDKIIVGQWRIQKKERLQSHDLSPSFAGGYWGYPDNFFEVLGLYAQNGERLVHIRQHTCDVMSDVVIESDMLELTEPCPPPRTPRSYSGIKALNLPALVTEQPPEDPTSYVYTIWGVVDYIYPNLPKIFVRSTYFKKAHAKAPKEEYANVFELSCIIDQLDEYSRAGLAAGSQIKVEVNALGDVHWLLIKLEAWDEKKDD